MIPGSCIFNIDSIPDTQRVDNLKDLIKEKSKPAFDHIRASALVLSIVSIPLDENLTETLANLPLAKQPALAGYKRLSQLFPASFETENLHIVVLPPFTPPKKRPLLSIELVPPRTRYCQEYAPKAPSSQGRALNFKRHQAKPDLMFYCNRPPPTSASTTIPVTLLHPVFGQFTDDYATYQPTSQG